jgi:hypothetical protein
MRPPGLHTGGCLEKVLHKSLHKTHHVHLCISVNRMVGSGLVEQCCGMLRVLLKDSEAS